MKGIFKACIFSISIITMFTFVGCNDTATSTSEPELDANNLTGRWYTKFAPAGCLDYTEYNDDGTFTGVSNNEEYGGTYTTDKITADIEYVELVMTWTDDNGLEDCWGDTADDTGMQLTLYADFPSADEILFYTSPDQSNTSYGFTKTAPQE